MFHRSERTVCRKPRVADDYLFVQIHSEHSGEQFVGGVNCADNVNSRDSVDSADRADEDSIIVQVV